MRHAALLPALFIAASASAQTVNTQLNGFTFTNGLDTLSDTSAIYGADKTVPINYLTDNDITTAVFNLGRNSASHTLKGSFSGVSDSSATGIYILGVVYMNGGTPLPAQGGFTLKLDLADGGSTAAISFTQNTDYIITATYVSELAIYQNSTFTAYTDSETTWAYAYVYASFDSFGTTYDQVVGIEMSSFLSQYPDITYIGAGYASPVPEPSTYGMILGGLALAGAAIRRRKNSK